MEIGTIPTSLKFLLKVGMLSWWFKMFLIFTRSSNGKNMANKKIIGLYPGSFDPVTNGHLDIAERAFKICDELHVAVVANPSKNSLFSIAERVELLKKTTKHLPKVVISSFNGLLVNYAKEIKANIIFRGLRAVSDFEFEFQMALINRSLQWPNWAGM
jgi:pantetheine-phosphate adenylyltransferase